MHSYIYIFKKKDVCILYILNFYLSQISVEFFKLKYIILYYMFKMFGVCIYYNCNLNILLKYHLCVIILNFDIFTLYNRYYDILIF